MDPRQNNFYFSSKAKVLLLAFCAAALSACSIYQSSAREAIQKNSGNIVTGFMLELNTKYECVRSNHAPNIWDNTSTSLDEYIESDLVEARLTQTEELPVVLVSVKDPAVADFEGCSLHILDSKVSSQRLHDVVAFGEKFLTTSHGNND